MHNFFFERYTVFVSTKTKNKKFFFQQIILIFAVCSENIYENFFYRFSQRSPKKQGILLN